MIWFVFAIILGLIGGGMLVFGGKSTDYPNFRPYSAIPFVIGGIFFLLSLIRVVSPGHVGVPVTFGKAGPARGSGIAFVAPWTGMRNVSIQVQNYTMSSAQGEGTQVGDDSVPVNTKDQVEVNVDSTALFKLTKGQARNVYVNIGNDFVTQVVRPTIRSAIRDAAVKYQAIDLATDDRAEFQAAARSQIEQTLSKYGIQVIDLQIRDMHLPANLQNSITAKAAAQQDVARQAFVLQSTQQQANQRVVAARGIRDAQDIIRQTLTPAYLQYEYIQTLQSLANSKNTTFLFVPNNPNGLPTFQLPLTSSAK